MKIIDGSSVYTFVSMFEGVNKGSLVLKGDLLKHIVGTLMNIKHSRGNIFDGSDKWNFYGPNYL